MRKTFLSALPIVLATISGALAIDLYLPAIPDLPRLLGGTPVQAQYSLSAFMAAFAVGQLVFGVLADRFNRRIVLNTALSLLAVTSLLCGLTDSMWHLVGLRALQGLAASAGAALAPALLREMAEGVAVVRLMGVVSSVQAIVPAVAPAVGTWIVQQWGWRWSFVAVAIFAAFAVTMFLINPLHPRKHPVRRDLHPLAGYAALIKSRRFLGYVVSHGWSFGALVTFTFAAPYVITAHTRAGIESFAIMQIALVTSFVAGANVAPLVVKRLGSDMTIVSAAALQIGGGVGLLAVTLLLRDVTVPAMAVAVAIINFGHGVRGGTGMARVMDVMPQHTGSASALMIFLSIGISSIATPVLAPYLALGAWPLGVAVAVQTILSLAVLPLAVAAEKSMDAPTEA